MKANNPVSWSRTSPSIDDTDIFIAPQPKLHNKNASSGEDSADMKEHNKDHNERHDRSNGKEDSKVGKGFWKDEPGSDTK